MSITHIVCRKFEGRGKRFKPGDEVDASDWTHLEAMEDNGFLRPVARRAPPKRVAKSKEVEEAQKAPRKVDTRPGAAEK